jgi:hypothetical protein
VVGTFRDRIAELRQMVGTGRLEGTVEVSQIYAHYQLRGMSGWTCTTRAADRPSTSKSR